MLYLETNGIEVKKTKINLSLSSFFESDFNAIVDKRTAFNELIGLALLAGESPNILRQLNQENVNYEKIRELQRQFEDLLYQVKKEIKTEIKTIKFK